MWLCRPSPFFAATVAAAAAGDGDGESLGDEGGVAECRRVSCAVSKAVPAVMDAGPAAYCLGALVARPARLRGLAALLLLSATGGGGAAAGGGAGGLAACAAGQVRALCPL